MKSTVLTVGHSNHTLEHFLQIVRANQVTAVADIRSEPYSAYASQFNREALKSFLEDSGVNYVFLGAELGARPQDPACYRNGKVQFKLMAATALFRKGLERIVSGSKNHCIAMMCTENDPLKCHRSVFISRELEALGAEVSHILEDGSVESQEQAMDRLLEQCGLPKEDLFRTRAEIIEDACARQEQKLAFVNDGIA
jgi:uncharacterized protein (DUF488 family)